MWRPIRRPPDSSAMRLAISNEAVAAGDGALSTWTWRGAALVVEIVDQLAVPAQRLGAYAGMGWQQAVIRKIGNELSEARQEALFGHRSCRFVQPGPPVAPPQSPQARPADTVHDVAGIDLQLGVALTGQCEDRVRAGVDRSVDHSGEVHAEEGE